MANDLGLHTRPATLIVKALEATQSSVSFHYNNQRADGKSVFSLLALSAPKDALVTVMVEGEDAQETMERLSIMFEEHFGE